MLGSNNNNSCSRDSSALFVTPRGSSLNDVEFSSPAESRFQYGARLQMQAPEEQPQQYQQQGDVEGQWEAAEQPQQLQEHWAQGQQWDQQSQQQGQPEQQWDQSQQQGQQPPEQWAGQEQWDQKQQQWQNQWQQQWQQEQSVAYPTEKPLSTQALNEAVAGQLQQNPQQKEDLNKIIGEGDWTQYPAKQPSWEYTKKLSSYTGFAALPNAKSPRGPQRNGSRLSGIQMVNSGIYVEGVKQWNAVTNEPVETFGEEARTIESRKFTFDPTSGDYINAHDPRDRMSADAMRELRTALSNAAVEETVVDLVKRRSTMRKMSTLSKMYLNIEKKELHALSGDPIMPAVTFAYLPDRYVKTYDRTNCLGQRVSTREHKCTCF